MMGRYSFKAPSAYAPSGYSMKTCKYTSSSQVFIRPLFKSTRVTAGTLIRRKMLS
jgi:hypothetical protein